MMSCDGSSVQPQEVSYQKIVCRVFVSFNEVDRIYLFSRYKNASFCTLNSLLNEVLKYDFFIKKIKIYGAFLNI